MTIDEETGKVFAAGWNLSAKLCDSCKSATSIIFCRADSAFLCINCDTKIHGANKLASRHERVWMCEVCEQAPASVTCKADAAALCVTCDRDIHAANPLARRHERFPVVPFYESAASALKSNTANNGNGNFLVPDGGIHNEDDEENDTVNCRDEAEAASWLLPNPKVMESPDLKSGDFFFSDVDPYLDLDYGSGGSGERYQNGSGGGSGNDSVVPVQTDTHHQPPVFNPSSFDLDFSRSKDSYSYPAPSLSQSVSSSSMDVGVVPDATDVSVSNNVYMMNGVDINGTAAVGQNQVAAVATQLTGMDREARVLRYREKRKNRKFEKTIRYASRKAYAETRPRIKGRFAKRTEIDTDVDRLYTTSGLMVDTSGYGVVPSF